LGHDRWLDDNAELPGGVVQYQRLSLDEKKPRQGAAFSVMQT